MWHFPKHLKTIQSGNHKVVDDELKYYSDQR